MSSSVTYRRDEDVAVIRMDDGKVNAVSPKLVAELNEALDRAERDGAVVLLTGRTRTFSAGYDLTMLRRGGMDAFRMVRGGLALAHRLLGFPTPVVVACNGHAIGMGLFLVLSGDYRIAASGSFKFSAPEVEIGLTVPHAAVELCRERINPEHFSRAVLLSETYSPESAVRAGMVDVVVAEDALEQTSTEAAHAFSRLDLQSHMRTKLRARKEVLRKMREALGEDTRDLLRLGAEQLLRSKFGMKTQRTRSRDG